MAVNTPTRASRFKKAVANSTPAKRGRPVGSKNKPKVDKPVDWEALAKKLQKALMKEMKKNDELEWQVKWYEDYLNELENRSWLSRLFNLKG